MKIVAFALLGTLAATGVSAAAMSDAQVRQEMIAESLTGYPGICPCPYNTARNGNSCGRRSAYSRPGGYSPLCYPTDISQAKVEEYRREHGQY